MRRSDYPDFSISSSIVVDLADKTPLQHNSTTAHIKPAASLASLARKAKTPSFNQMCRNEPIKYTRCGHILAQIVRCKAAIDGNTQCPDTSIQVYPATENSWALCPGCWRRSQEGQ